MLKKGIVLLLLLLLLLLLHAKCGIRCLVRRLQRCV
jgi:succinate dehydrogenase hydrophobic anchor subunit